jgi:hypothetical protein
VDFILGYHPFSGFSRDADFSRIGRDRFDIVCRHESKSASFVRRCALYGYKRPFVGFVVYDQGSVFGYGDFVFCCRFVFVERFGVSEWRRL